MRPGKEGNKQSPSNQTHGVGPGSAIYYNESQLLFLSRNLSPSETRSLTHKALNMTLNAN